MGRALLILWMAALVTAAACAPASEPAASGALANATATTVDPHADLTCAACHNGGLPGARRAAVPREACAASGCHEEGGPATVSTATATFRHRDHAQDGELALSCAGCHTHDAGELPLRVSVDGCALCHLSDLEGGSPDDCRLCHQQPKHVGLTQQGLPIPHSALPWVETGCVRCHYDVAEPQTRVPLNRCTGCHADDDGVVARGIATDLHPGHVSVTCTACHEGDAHRVRAMSSAVQLACADCHVAAHALELGTEWRGDDTCASCHEYVHAAQQQLLLGLVAGAPPSPSSKFVAGMTCRSCHIRTERAVASGAAIRGQAEACASCHRTEYREVLDWWIEGARTRATQVARYIETATVDLAVAPDSAAVLLGGARTMIELVRTAGGHHNLELSDRIFRQSIERVRGAYAQAGRLPPTPPALGSPAHEGVCSFCHYSTAEAWDFTRMSGPLHRDILNTGR